MFLKILIPSWRFFNETGAIPRLYVRTFQSGQLENSWVPVLKAPRRRWYSFFVNPEGGLYHAVCNALEFLLTHPDHKDANRVIHRYVRYHLLRERGVLPGGRYQFKVTALQFVKGQAVEEDSLLSSEEDL